MFRRPRDDDDGDDDGEDMYGQEVVRAKPISSKYASKLGALGAGKDFVRGSDSSQRELSGVMPSSAGRPLTEADRNKLSARLLKAKMKGDKNLERELRQQLESGVAQEEKVDEDSGGTRHKTEMLLRRDRSGNVIPASRAGKAGPETHKQTTSSAVQRELGKSQSLDDMLREEKSTSASDQLRLFDRALVASAKIRRHDDESVDDIAEMQKRRRRHNEKDERREKKAMMTEHRRVERSLDDCLRCLTSRLLPKHAVVAIGIHTYLAVAEWDGLHEEHCLLIPSEHAASSIQLDENVYDELRLWRKGLVAMWRERGLDCVFVEMARHVDEHPHVIVEAIPFPEEAGDSVAIFFKKAIDECERGANNKRLIQVTNLRRQIPRGFSYFAVDFGLQNGYAHVIEDHAQIRENFAHEVVGGMLDLPHTLWRKKNKLPFEQVKQRTDAFKKFWEPFDWTRRIRDVQPLTDEPSTTSRQIGERTAQGSGAEQKAQNSGDKDDSASVSSASSSSSSPERKRSKKEAKKKRKKEKKRSKKRKEEKSKTKKSRRQSSTSSSD